MNMYLIIGFVDSSSYFEWNPDITRPAKGPSENVRWG